MITASTESVVETPLREIKLARRALEEVLAFTRLGIVKKRPDPPINEDVFEIVLHVVWTTVSNGGQFYEGWLPPLTESPSVTAGNRILQACEDPDSTEDKIEFISLVSGYVNVFNLYCKTDNAVSGVALQSTRSGNSFVAVYET